MARLRCLVLLIHGTEDAVVPFGDARRLMAAGQPGQVRRLALKGGHDPGQSLKKHFPQVIDFLQQAFSVPLHETVQYKPCDCLKIKTTT